jgi:hypothetical protein
MLVGQACFLICQVISARTELQGFIGQPLFNRVILHVLSTLILVPLFLIFLAWPILDEPREPSGPRRVRCG